MKTLSIVSVAVGATLIGVAIGVLTAPHKGSKTRKRIADKGHDYKDYLEDNYEDLAHSVSHPFENLEEETMRLSKKANTKAKEIKAEIDKKIS